MNFAPLLSEFSHFPVFIQILIISACWLFVTFLVDCWFTPFVIHGYQLASYLSILIVLSAWMTFQGVQHLKLSRNVYNFSRRSNSVPASSAKLSIGDITEHEINLRVRNACQAINNYWYDEISDSDEFPKEIQSHIEDVLALLTRKLSRVDIEVVAHSTVLIFHNHLKAYLRAVKSHGTARLDQFSYSHPVSRGEVTLEAYLNALAAGLLHEFVPGSIQDCRAVYSLICTVFSSQVLLKLVNLAQPENVLESIIRVLDSLKDARTADGTDCGPPAADSQDSDRDTSHLLNSTSFKDCPTEYSCLEETVYSEDGQLKLSGGDDDDDGDEEKDYVSMKDDESWNGGGGGCGGGGMGSPVLAGSLVLSQPDSNVLCIKTGLSLTLATVAAPLLSQCEELLHACSDSAFEDAADVVGGRLPRKPSCLPVVINRPSSDLKDATDDAVKSPSSLPAGDDVSPVYEDVEDFATAIAKLRSLLEQKESRESIDSANAKSENTSTSPSDFRCVDTFRFGFFLSSI